MLRKEVWTHKKHYFSLLLGLGCFVLLILYFWPNVFWVRVIGLTMGIFYIVWGILTHTYAPRKVFWEYVVVATVGISAIIFLTI